MSLFIGSLAFEQGGSNIAVDDRVGILAGSLASGILGYVILRFSKSDLPKERQLLDETGKTGHKIQTPKL